MTMDPTDLLHSRYYDSPTDEIVKRAARPTILSDIDGVLAFESEAEIGALNAAFGYQIHPLLHPSMLNLVPADHVWLESLKATSSFIWSVAPDYHGLDALLAIAEAGYDVIIASERPASLAVVTESWFRRWSPDLRKQAKFVLEGPGSKVRTADSFGPKDPLVWIDDDVKFWTRARPGVSIWTPKLPWNDQVPPPGVTRFGKWAKLLRFLGVEE